MSLADKLRALAREAADEAYRDLAAVANNTNQANPTLCKIIQVQGNNQFTVLLATGETQVVQGGGNRPLALGESYHIVGGVIF